MTYNEDHTWDSLSRMLSAACRQATTALVEWNELRKRWGSFRAGRNDATIATALGKAEADVTAMRKAFVALEELHDYANNQTPTQADYLSDLRKFV